MTFLTRFTKRLLLTVSSLALTIVLLATLIWAYAAWQLPDVEHLKDLQFQVPMRVYSRDGQLMAVYGQKHRIPVTLDEIPPQLINAVLATEDQRYYQHNGVDFIGLMRAAKTVLKTGQKSQGASTITMQVARNFFLSRKKTYGRKFNEILLAIKIDSTLTKERILELYLNKIYFGQRAYGVAAAAQVYYGKPLQELSLAEMAMIAGLPRAPSRDNPVRRPNAAKARRNHVLERMFEHGFITQKAYNEAVNAPITAHLHTQQVSFYAPYVSEIVREAILEKYGNQAYSSGLKVYTTVSQENQQQAHNALRNGLIRYSLRHGYRGPEKHLSTAPDADYLNWATALKQLSPYNDLEPVAVIEVNSQNAEAVRANGDIITIPWEGLAWARRKLGEHYLGPLPQTADEVVHIGDVVRVQPTEDSWTLSQLPQVEGALVSINPHNGKVLAMVGGFDYKRSHFNRALDGWRQPGSAFKPFIYSAALEKGFTLASTINDAPVVLPGTGEDTLWRPQNDQRRFGGLTRLRTGLIQSRNLVSIRLLDQIGIQYALNYLARFEFDLNRQPHSLSLALGSGLVTPIQLAAGYASIANGGYRVYPHIIDRVSNEKNQIIYQAKEATLDHRPADAKQILTPQNAYLIDDALRDVIQHGTGRKALDLHRDDLAGKTGTTNKQVDAWFSGYNNDIATTVWVGYDQPHSLYEYGAQAALPIWMDFMKAALKGKPAHTLHRPSDLITVRIDPTSGLRARPEQDDAIFEIFRKNRVPTTMATNTTDTNSHNASNTTPNIDTQELF